VLKLEPRERRMLAAFVIAGVAVRVLYVLSTRHIGLAGDEIEYDREARFIVGGHWFWKIGRAHV